MKKITIIAFFIALCNKLLLSQLIFFNFNNEPYVSPSYLNDSLLFSEFLLSSGTVNENITTGDYFVDEPYVEESGGWGKTSLTEAKFFYVDIQAKEGFQYNIYSVTFEFYVTGSGPSALSVLLGDSLIYTQNVMDGQLYQLVVSCENLSNLKHKQLKIAGWDNGSRETSGNGAFRLDNLAVYGGISELPPNDTNSSISLGNTNFPPQLSSVVNEPPGIHVVDVVITDFATSDALPTQIDSLYFSQSISNEIFNWTQIIKGAKLLLNGIITQTAVEIRDSVLFFYPANSFIVSDGQADTLSLFIGLNENLQGFDNLHLGMQLLPNQVFCNSSGSKVGAGAVVSISDQLNISVVANQLQVGFSEDQVFSDSAFHIQVKAVDINGNIDKDIHGNLEIYYSSTKGNLNVESPITGKFTQGIFSSQNLIYSGSDTVEFEIIADEIEQTWSGFKLIGRHFYSENFSGNLMKWNNIQDWMIVEDTLTNNHLLKHNLVDVSGTSFISSSYENSSINNGTMVWRMTLKNGDFDPTSSNRFWYYVMASSSNLLLDTLSGYAVGVNLSGATDSLSLWKVNNGDKELLIQSDFEWSENDSLPIELVRTAQGNWQLNYVFQNSVFASNSEQVKDSLFDNLWHHGLVFQYTSTRAGELWFNDYYSFQLNTPPIFQSVEVKADSIFLNFSEALSNAGVENLSNYQLTSETDTQIKIESAALNPKKSHQICLIVNRLQTAEYQVKVSGLTDLEGSEIIDQSLTFSYSKLANRFDIVINEIMFDPNPVVDLPEADYLEIYNNSSNTYNLQNWIIEIGGIQKVFPEIVLAPDDYLILTSDNYLNEFTEFGASLGFISSSALTIGGKTIKLISSENLLIDSVYYSQDWIDDDEKIDGGWSIERIDPNNVCSASGNWAVSKHPAGGTPGKENSVRADNLDQDQPKIVQAIPIASNQIKITFSEEVMIDENTHHNFVLNETDFASLIYKDSVNSKALIVSFLNEFLPDQNCKLSIQNISDFCSNIIRDTLIEFVYYKAQLYDVVFNEIMMNPSPSVGLPEFEYIELANTSDKTLFIYNWKIFINNSARIIESAIIEPESMILLGNNELFSFLDFYTEVISVDNFPALPMSATLHLFDNSNQLICQTNYSSAWISDDFKADGGFSLERIDWNNPTEDESNWQVSEAEIGGTPGKENSVYKENPDLTSPDLLRAYPLNETVLMLDFSELMDFSEISKPDILINGNSDGIMWIQINQQNLANLTIYLTENLNADERYQLKIAKELTDISGNKLQNNKAEFAMFSNTAEKDIIINEILFNPKGDGVDFVEIYNRSEQTVNLKQLLIAKRDDYGDLSSVEKITNSGAVLLPENYMVLSINDQAIKSQYKIRNNFAFYNVNQMPAFSDNEGSVVLLDTLGTIIDEFAYSEDMHFALLVENEGVSLERINPENETQSIKNWHSASELSGWATPGYVNSVYAQIESFKDEITVEPEVFSPDNDGFKDFATFSYQFDEPGYVATVAIYDKVGRKLRDIANNELLGVSGYWIWDGLTNEQQKSPAGIYIVYCEIFNLQGEVKKYKKVCTVNVQF